MGGVSVATPPLDAPNGDEVQDKEEEEEDDDDEDDDEDDDDDEEEEEEALDAVSEASGVWWRWMTAASSCVSETPAPNGRCWHSDATSHSVTPKLHTSLADDHSSCTHVESNAGSLGS